MDKVTNETVGSVMSRQVVVPAWMQQVADEHGQDAPVAVTTRHTPFGNFTVGMEVSA